MHKIGTVTSKGQITLPMSWRKQNKVNQVLITENNNSLVIEPMEIKNYKKRDVDTGEKIIFDADRDNNGEGIDADDIIKMIDELNGQD
jgi:bifunctional DNA-binding transcriptional regulator/antitoxin component of YhaV-PrlF toxin-antitoxin module